METEKLNIVSNFEKYITSEKIDKSEGKLFYIDFNTEDEKRELETILNDKDKLEFAVNNDLKVFTQNYTLTEDITEDSIVSDYVRKVIELSNLFSEDNISIGLLDEPKEIIGKIYDSINYIQLRGNLGKPTNMVISKNNYDNLPKLVKDKFAEEEFVIYFTDCVDDMILYRKNDWGQIGLFLLHNGEKYYMMEVGFYPERQFYKIKLA